MVFRRPQSFHIITIFILYLRSTHSSNLRCIFSWIGKFYYRQQLMGPLSSQLAQRKKWLLKFKTYIKHNNEMQGIKNSNKAIKTCTLQVYYPALWFFNLRKRIGRSISHVVINKVIHSICVWKLPGIITRNWYQLFSPIWTQLPQRKY